MSASAWSRQCERTEWHISHQWGVEHGDMGVIWYECDGRYEHISDMIYNDPEPQPDEVEDYHAAIYAWRERQLTNGDNDNG